MEIKRRKSKTFVPVIIKLNTLEELQVLVCTLGLRTNQDMKTSISIYEEYMGLDSDRACEIAGKNFSELSDLLKEEMGLE